MSILRFFLFGQCGSPLAHPGTRGDRVARPGYRQNARRATVIRRCPMIPERLGEHSPP